jgi:hypothetical protein
LTDEEFFSMIDEEVALCERFGLTEVAEQFRACRTLREAIDLHADLMDALGAARLLNRAHR